MKLSDRIFQLVTSSDRLTLNELAEKHGEPIEGKSLTSKQTTVFASLELLELLEINKMTAYHASGSLYIEFEGKTHSIPSQSLKVIISELGTIKGMPTSEAHHHTFPSSVIKQLISTVPEYGFSENLTSK